MRWLFVHAHPDDETLSTGAIISCLVSRGETCLVLTATRGEMGEAVPGTLGPGEDLATVRQAERTQSLTALGAEDAGWLGKGPNRWRGTETSTMAQGGGSGPNDRIYTDSGMSWISPILAGPGLASGLDSLCSADFDEIVRDIVVSATNHGAQALVSYDDAGGYGHPDHVRCHQATRAAAGRLGLPFFEIVGDPALADEWYEVGNLGDLLTAHRAYRTQFTVEMPADSSAVEEMVIRHVGGQMDLVRVAAGLRLVIPPPAG